MTPLSPARPSDVPGVGGSAASWRAERAAGPPRRTPTAAVDAAYDRIAGDGRAGIWIELVPRAEALAAAAEVEADLAAGADRPLAGCTLAVKNNVDVAGLRTTAGCPTFGEVAPAHAPVVQALVDAGAVVVGVTNLDQFATGLVGTRSPYGVCPNARWPGLVAGGSSSGSAVAVAAGHVDLAIGTDTAGSGRVPAAANGIVGLKPTPGRIATDGVVPACRSLDCVSFFARDLDLAALAYAVGAAGAPGPTSGGARVEVDLAVTGAGMGVDNGATVRLGVPDDESLTFDGDPAARAGFEAALAVVRDRLGAPAPVDFAPFVAAGRLLYEGAFVVERYEAVGGFIEAHPGEVDPVVAGIITAAASISADDLARDRVRLAELGERTAPVWQAVDVLVVPSVPRVPTVAEVLAEPLTVNAMLGTYTNFVNLLGLCALTVPCPPRTSSPAVAPPPSVTLVAPGGHDELLVDLARRLAG